MSHLGSFGAAVKEISGERDTFDFFGEKFEIIDAIPPMLMLQLGASTTGKIDEQEGLGAMWETIRTSLGDEQFTRFYRLAVSQRCDFNSLMDLALKLFEVQAGRPTEEPQGSSAGPSTTSPNSNGSPSVHPAFAHLTPVNELVNRAPAG